jgi:hypothetical protein
MAETFVRIAGKWMYLFRAVDSHGQTVDFYLSERRDRETRRVKKLGADRSGERQARHLHPLAPQGLPSPLAPEITTSWQASNTQRPAETDPGDGGGESDLG